MKKRNTMIWFSFIFFLLITIACSSTKSIPHPTDIPVDPELKAVNDLAETVFQALKIKDLATIRSLADNPDGYCDDLNTVDLGDNYTIVMSIRPQSSADIANGIKYAESQTFKGIIRVSNNPYVKNPSWQDFNDGFMRLINRGNGWKLSYFGILSYTPIFISLSCDVPGQ
jgi:hypothetical protein